MEKVIDIFSKQKHDVVLLSQPPYNNEPFLSSYSLIGQECGVYLGNEKKYKYGEQENVVYERVNNLRYANVSISILFNLKEGAMFDDHGVGLMAPSLEQAVKSTHR